MNSLRLSLWRWFASTLPLRWWFSGGGWHSTPSRPPPPVRQGVATSSLPARELTPSSLQWYFVSIPSGSHPAPPLAATSTGGSLPPHRWRFSLPVWCWLASRILSVVVRRPLSLSLDAFRDMFLILPVFHTSCIHSAFAFLGSWVLCGFLLVCAQPWFSHQHCFVRGIRDSSPLGSDIAPCRRVDTTPGAKPSWRGVWRTCETVFYLASVHRLRLWLLCWGPLHRSSLSTRWTRKQQEHWDWGGVYCMVTHFYMRECSWPLSATRNDLWPSLAVAPWRCGGGASCRGLRWATYGCDRIDWEF